MSDCTCRCEELTVPGYPYPFKAKVVRCKRCLKRDELWDEMVNYLKQDPSLWSDLRWDQRDNLLARAKECS